MAVNTIVDIVKISELDQLQVPTTKDELVINNFLVNQDYKLRQLIMQMK